MLTTLLSNSCLLLQVYTTEEDNRNFPKCVTDLVLCHCARISQSLLFCFFWSIKNRRNQILGNINMLALVITPGGKDHQKQPVNRSNGKNPGKTGGSEQQDIKTEWAKLEIDLIMSPQDLDQCCEDNIKYRDMNTSLRVHYNDVHTLYCASF